LRAKRQVYKHPGKGWEERVIKEIYQVGIRLFLHKTKDETACRG
jgi:hypothetical protein